MSKLINIEISVIRNKVNQHIQILYQYYLPNSTLPSRFPLWKGIKGQSKTRVGHPLTWPDKVAIGIDSASCFCTDPYTNVPFWCLYIWLFFPFTVFGEILDWLL